MNNNKLNLPHNKLFFIYVATLEFSRT